MRIIAISLVILLALSLLLKKSANIETEGFLNYIVYVPTPSRGPWYGGRWRYQPWWGYRRRWWNELYQPTPWGPCPGPWCPYR